MSTAVLINRGSPQPSGRTSLMDVHRSCRVAQEPLRRQTPFQTDAAAASRWQTSLERGALLWKASTRTISVRWPRPGLAFPTGMGTLLDPANPRRSLRQVTERAGLGFWHPHELLPSTASRPRTVSRLHLLDAHRWPGRALRIGWDRSRPNGHRSHPGVTSGIRPPAATTRTLTPKPGTCRHLRHLPRPAVPNPPARRCRPSSYQFQGRVDPALAPPNAGRRGAVARR